MEQYKIDYKNSRVYVTEDSVFTTGGFLQFKYLEVSTPPYKSLTNDRSDAYAIARDQLTDEGLIVPTPQYEE